MDYRCSSSIAGLILLIGGSSALLAPAASAGDPIEFSAPAIPLAIPQPEVEAKEPSKPITSISPAEDPTYDGDFFAPPEVTTANPRTKARDLWDTSPFQDSDPRATDNLFNPSEGPNRSANKKLSDSRRAWEASEAEGMPLRNGDSMDSKLGDDPNASRFGAPNEWDRNNGRDGGLHGGDLFGRIDPTKKNESSLLKMFTLNPASSDRVSAWTPKSFFGEFQTLTGGGSVDQKFKLGPPTDSARIPTVPSGYGSYDSKDQRQDQQAGQTAGSARPWESADARPAPVKRAPDPNHLDPSRGLAPMRPINLLLPKRPSDPNPY